MSDYKTKSAKQREKEKKLQESYQAVLARLLREEDNKYCIDCEAKGPRWASWNLGIFLCIRCAGIHRNLGVHISKVKSVNLDSWTEEQMHSIEDTGNTVGRKLYEGNLPSGFRRPQTNTALEHFIRAKYEHKKYIDKDYVKPPVRHTVYNDPDKEKKRKTKGQSSNVSLPKSKESTSTSSSAKKEPAPTTMSQAAPASTAAAAVSRPEPVRTQLTVQQVPQQKSVSLPTTPVTRRKAVDDLLGLDTPPATTNLLGMHTPQHPSGQSASSNNLTSNSEIEVSLFGDETDIIKPGQTSMKNKDSIMALYGSGGQKQPVYGVPGGMYIPAVQQTQQQQQHPQQQQQQYNMANGYNNSMPTAAMPQASLGRTQGMMGNHGMMGNQSMMARQQPGVGVPGMYNAQVLQQQQTYLNQPANQQQPISQQPIPQQPLQQQQQPSPQGQTQITQAQSVPRNYHMMQMQHQYYHHHQQQLQQQMHQQQQMQQWQQMQFNMQQYQLQQQQIQQQMKSLQVNNTGMPQQVPGNWQQAATTGIPQTADIPSSASNGMTWGNGASSGQTLSTNLWK